MPILPVNQVSALSSGADLWVCPDMQNSTWAIQIDWYLNHIISNSELHVTPKMSHDLKSLLFENELVFHDISSTNLDTLIACTQQLPAQWLLVAPWNGQIQKWLSRLQEHWKKLNYPTMRLFLPKGISTSECSREWQKLTDRQDFTVVLDKD